MNEQLIISMKEFQIKLDEIIIRVLLVVSMDHVQDILKQDPIEKKELIFIQKNIFKPTF